MLTCKFVVDEGVELQAGDNSFPVNVKEKDIELLPMQAGLRGHVATIHLTPGNAFVLKKKKK